MLAGGGSLANGLEPERLGGSTIEGLEFTGFTGSAITVGSSSNHIGGSTTTGQGNTIDTSLAGSVGVSVTGASNVLEGNFIGSVTSTPGGFGVEINGAGAKNNSVGGATTDVGNTFAFNGSDANHGALTVNVGTGNTILTDLFFQNAVTGTASDTSGIKLTNGGNNGGATRRNWRPRSSRRSLLRARGRRSSR